MAHIPPVVPDERDNGEHDEGGGDGHAAFNWRPYAIGAGTVLGISLLGYALFGGCKGKQPEPVTPATIEATNDYVTQGYVSTSGLPQDYLAVETRDGDKTKTYKFKAASGEQAKGASERIHAGDRLTFMPGADATGITIEPYPGGEIPFGRDLVVKNYEIDYQRNFRNPSKVDTPIATVLAEFAGTGIKERYILVITGQTEEAVEQTVRHLQRYDVLRINEQDEAFLGRRGERGDRVQLMPTERGPELRVPWYRLNWSDRYQFNVDGHVLRAVGQIRPDKIDRPWEPKPAPADSAAAAQPAKTPTKPAAHDTSHAKRQTAAPKKAGARSQIPYEKLDRSVNSLRAGFHDYAEGDSARTERIVQRALDAHYEPVLGDVRGIRDILGTTSARVDTVYDLFGVRPRLELRALDKDAAGKRAEGIPNPTYRWDRGKLKDEIRRSGKP